MAKKYNRKRYSIFSFKSSLLHVAILFFVGMAPGWAQEPDFAWVKRFGNNAQLAYGPVATVDSQGNSYVAGVYLSANFNLDGTLFQSPTIPNAGISGYIAKYDAAGQLLWAKPTQGILSVVLLSSPPNTGKLIIDGSGNVYFTGEYESGKTSSINNYTISTYNSEQQGHQNFFLAKLDSDGNVTWVQTSTRAYYYYAGSPVYNDIHFDLEGNINMTGYFRDSILFSPQHILSHDADEGAVFLTKYSPQGTIILCQKLEGSVNPPFNVTGSASEQIKQDAQGNLYRWSNNQTLKKIYKYDVGGNLVSSNVIDAYYSNNGAVNYPSLQGFSVDPQGNTFISGYFYGELMLEGQSYSGLNNSAHSDAVLFKLSTNFEVLWAHVPSINYSDSFDKLYSDALGNVYAAGQINSPLENQMLIKKFNTDGAMVWQKIIAGVESPTQPLGGIHALSICPAADGGNVWISGTFRRNAYFDATAHFITSNLNSYNGFLVQYGSCNTETPTINTPAATAICAGETIELSADFSNPDLLYRWNTGQTTESITVDHAGIYYVIAQENEECYGKSQEIWITELPVPEVEVNFENGALFALAENVTYQWVNCDTQEPISGQTAENYTPGQAGSYAVEVTSGNGCTALSECRTVTESELSVDTFLNGTSFILYPNPAKNILVIQTDAVIISIEVTNMLGQKIMAYTNTDMDVSALPAGSYLLKATTDRGTYQRKFIKQ